MKNYKLKKEEINKIIKLNGSCIASNKITIEGMKIEYMYKEKPTNEIDSGWRFFAGTEDEKYTNNPDNFGIFDLNTICNYDESIIPYLKSQVGDSFEKTNGKFTKIIDIKNK